MYRQITLQTLFSGTPPTAEERALAYNDVVAAWKTYSTSTTTAAA